MTGGTKSSRPGRLGAAPAPPALLRRSCQICLLLAACYRCPVGPPLHTVVRLGLHFLILQLSRPAQHRLLRPARPFVRSSLFDRRASIHPLHFQVSPGPSCLAFPALSLASLGSALHCFRPRLPLPSTRAISLWSTFPSVHSISGPSILFLLLLILLLILLLPLLLPRLPPRLPPYPPTPLPSSHPVVLLLLLLALRWGSDCGPELTTPSWPLPSCGSCLVALPESQACVTGLFCSPSRGL